MSEETERSESSDAANISKPKSVGSSGNANVRGYLWRLGGHDSIFSKKTWKKRWCVLCKGKFDYYSSKEEWQKYTNNVKNEGIYHMYNAKLYYENTNVDMLFFSRTTIVTLITPCYLLKVNIENQLSK